MATLSDNPGVRRQMGRGDDDPQARPGMGLPVHLLGKLATKATHPAVILAETLLLPLLAVGLGLIWAPQDPLQVQTSFPWPWLAPVVLALRYGPMAGLVGASVLLIGWLALNAGHWDIFPQLYFLGGLILVMLVGEFSSLWQARARRAETLQLYLDQRLEHLVRQHYLLRLSHDRLEQELIGRPMSMRDALSGLREAGRGEEQAPQALLRLLAQYCQLECAAIHTVTKGHVAAQASASIGAHDPLQADDPLLRQALQTHRLCHIRQVQNGPPGTRYLVAAPLLDLDGEMYGLLVVQEMPFFALQEENLQTLQLLLGYYTDGLSMDALARPIVKQFPDCPPLFAFELQRLAHIHASAQVPSIVVALECQPRALEQDLPAQVERLKRELDEAWLIRAPQRQVLAVLMPLGNATTAEGYVRRLEAWMQQKSQQSLAQAGIFPHVVPLDSAQPERILQRLHSIAHA
ncbi:PelD GGDEF domain-containing protein [Alicycliphilus denitrificans]|uniref:PelD GGDEF domain-containing protein n=1 Tax=Alicycliphilus denitrificans TaxID=179636 RepID=UPI00384E7BF4